jgi:vacuolar-type H+-ATPase subunit E/Vma4
MTGRDPDTSPGAQEDLLRDEILEDARRRADRTLKRAERDAAKALDRARQDLETQRQATLEQARTRAEGEVRALIAGVEQEKRRRRLQVREEALDDVLQSALDQARNLAEPARARESRTRLLIEAARAVGPEDGLVIEVDAVTCGLLTEDGIRALVTGLGDEVPPPEVRVIDRPDTLSDAWSRNCAVRPWGCWRNPCRRRRTRLKTRRRMPERCPEPPANRRDPLPPSPPTAGSSASTDRLSRPRTWLKPPCSRWWRWGMNT